MVEAMVMRDKSFNRVAVVAVKELKRDWANRPDRYVVIDKDFCENKPNTTRDFNTEFHRTVRDFVLASTKHIPDCLAVYDRQEDEMVIYRDADLFVLGRMSLTYTDDNETQYNVRSHLITNKRYCPHTSPREYRTLTSIKFDKAVRNARTYLRGNTLQDIARCTVEKMSNSCSVLTDTFRKDANKALNALGVDRTIYNLYSDHEEPPILKELTRLHELGTVSFMDSSIGENLDKYRENFETMKELAKFTVATLCHVYKNHRDVEVIEYHDVFTDQYYSHHGLHSDKYVERYGDIGKLIFSDSKYCCSPTVVPAENADPHMQTQVASLAVLPDETFVRGLGYKLNDSIYYVTKPN